MLSFVLFFLSFLSFGAFKPIDPELTDYEYPFPVQFYELKLRDQTLRMAYMENSPRENAKGVVVLLHGKNFSGNYWERTANDLVKSGYRVVIPDQIGFGKSTKPENYPYSFQLLATNTFELLKSLGVTEFILVGHSMGGMLATRMALMYPKEVKKLVLVNPIGLEDWKTMVPYKPLNELYQVELQNNETKIRDYQKAAYYDGKWKPEYEKSIEIAVGWTLHKNYPLIAWNAALTSEMIFTQPVVYELKHLQMPTLLMNGTRDRTAIGKGWADPKVKSQLGRYDLLGKKIIRQIPRGELAELPGVGHLPQVEAYDSYWQRLLKFISK